VSEQAPVKRGRPMRRVRRTLRRLAADKRPWVAKKAQRELKRFFREEWKPCLDV